MANSEIAAPDSTSRSPARTDAALAPISESGRSMARIAAEMSSSAPAKGPVTNTTAASGASPNWSSTSPTTSPTAWVANGCWDMAAANGIGQSWGGGGATGGSKVNGTWVT